MKIKRYFASDMRQAIKLVKDDLGADAAIVSQRKVVGGVEVSASIDDTLPRHADAASDGGHHSLTQALAAAKGRVNDAEHNVTGFAVEHSIGADDVTSKEAMKRTLQSIQGQRAGSLTSVGRTESASVNTRPHRDSEQLALESMRDELNNMRELLQQQLGSVAWGQFVERSPQQAVFWRRLTGMGLSADICKQLIAGVDPRKAAADNWRQILAVLSRQLYTTQKNLVLEGGIFAFIGPTGSGKTTTIGKLATQYVMEHGANSIALVTTDCYRVGASEQIKTLGRILNVAVRVVEKPNELQSTLDSLRDKSLILIDTAGLHQQDPNLQLQLKMLDQVRPMVRSLLVLAATSQQQVMRAAYHTYGSARLVGAVLSKLDEAVSLGEAMSLVIENQLPVTYLADGQRIPQDISLARAHNLVSRAVAISEQLPEDDEKMISDFSAVRKNGVGNVSRFVS